MQTKDGVICLITEALIKTQYVLQFKRAILKIESENQRGYYRVLASDPYV
jgi:hypothetical protein